MTEHVVPVEAVDYTLAQFDDTLTALLAALGYDPATQSVLRANPFGRNTLEVTGATSPVSVDTGDAIVNGRRYWNDAVKDIVIPTPSAATRIDRIVLRLDYAGNPQTITAERLAGVEGGAAPALTQIDGTTWEVSLAQVSITTAGAITITDERAYVGDAGIVADALAATVAGDGLSGGAGAALAVEVDDSTIEISNGALQVKDGGITAVKLAGTATGFVKGMILPFSGTFDGHFPIDPDTAAADTRWHLCNGDTENGVATPDLRDRFVIAAGATYAAGTSGGSATKDLSHTHGVGTYVTNAHTHSVSLQTAQGTSGAQLPAGGGSMYENIVNHTHGVTGDTGGAQPGLTGSSASGGSATQDIMPPYYALAYICYVGA